MSQEERTGVRQALARPGLRVTRAAAPSGWTATLRIAPRAGPPEPRYAVIAVKLRGN
jgi:hypothetical protein